jgi:16S rRNA (adenine1518-N6/adenine1519-N6)-dimethyltransferase
MINCFMYLNEVKSIKELFDENNIKPNKKLGQNFLINDVFVQKIISYVKENKNIVEIGPGTGILTKELCKISPKIIAIEKDYNLINILKKTFKNDKNLEIVHGDALIEIEKTLTNKSKDYIVVSNLPYSVATAVIRKFLELEKKPDEMILMIQKEVAERILAKPPLLKNNKFHQRKKSINMNVLAVSVQFYATAEKLFNIPKNAFWPQPKVDSSLIKITPHKDFCFEKNFSIKFFKILKAGFSSPRAQLLNNLSKKLKLEKEFIQKKLFLCNINPERRAETLSIEDWINLTKEL